MKDSRLYKKSLFIHRRDLRVQDNTGLNEALEKSEEVLSCFIFDPKQIGNENKYKSDKHVNFMIESLEDLEEQYIKIKGKIHLFSGAPHKIIEELVKKEKINAVFVNVDYTPYSKERDDLVRAMCEKNNIPFVGLHDLLLSGDPALIKNGSGKPFTVFTPYWNKAQLTKVEAPVKVKSGTFICGDIQGPKEVSLQEFKPNIDVSKVEIKGGRVRGRKILKDATAFQDYDKTRNSPFINATQLSAHNKFGTVSIREVFHTFGIAIGYHHSLLRQLYWRDFYTYIVYHFPHVIGNSFDKKHEIIFWNKEAKGFDEWKNGKTGIPIVDAGMRELNESGYMHNRVRLIVGSFLTKDMHIPWWLGEQYFAQKLIDYDISVNNGNWQWVGGTGVDPVPYFRIFNPWLQAKKFDPDAIYIKKWVPELESLSAKQIHSLFKNDVPEGIKYPKPILDHTEEMRKVKGKYI